MTREQRAENFRRLESLVEARNISFYQLANDTAIPQSVFSDWKVGRSMPKANKLNKIAEYFGVDASYFTQGEKRGERNGNSSISNYRGNH